jgi:BirA family biotin operon repressor/biotin-[acetyl-CoA-carboxylase] ligase
VWDLPPGWILRYLPLTNSTNDDAQALARAGCPDRTIVLADEQRAGRGRLGRTWTAPPGRTLLFSIVFRRTITPIYLTALCSVSIAEAIRGLTGFQATIKWPNDVMMGDRKVCGILAEAIWQQQPQITVVGIGLNVNVDPVADGLPPTATSLSQQIGYSVARDVVLRTILQRLDYHLARSDGRLDGYIRPYWEALLWRQHQAVRIDRDGTVLHGSVEGLAESGALRVRQPDGSLAEIAVGDVLLE